MYDRILERIEDSGEETAVIARRALRWIAGAQWPITLAQLAEAIMIEPCSTELSTDYLVTSNAVILEVLSSLVHKADNDAVNLPHFSILEYLISSYLLKTSFSSYHLLVQSVLANKMFALIIDCMLIDDFNRPLFEVEDEFDHFFDDKHPFYGNAGQSWNIYLSFIDANNLETFEALSRSVRAA
ncbi:hypothetical protein DFH09DRAFT_1155120 [Mycena vulgaris]|nr:hypothetical protein DFH09DRAFT_1155120 [Mycena vulgaris]